MTRQHQRCLSALWATFALAAFATPLARGQAYSVLHRFTGPDGTLPEGVLVADSGGNLFGTTLLGGPFGWGTVFKVDKTGLTVLYGFPGGADGGAVPAGLIRDAEGALFGVTHQGGGRDDGTVFKVDAAAAETVLHRFTGGPDGFGPVGGLMRGAKGVLYGTTSAGGTAGAGTVFKLDQTGFTVLYSFKGGADGVSPYAGLIQDAAGNLYGTTFFGGAAGFGTAFKLDTAGTETVLYTFTGGADGGNPNAGLIQDSAGNLYGTAISGGLDNSTCHNENPSGCGVVFKLNPAGTQTVLHSFTGGADGGNPYAGLIRDRAGNFYGTTAGGGQGGGVVFKLDADGRETVLHNFNAETDGVNPVAGLLRDSAGNLYGTTSNGGVTNTQCGSGCGVVFKIVP